MASGQLNFTFIGRSGCGKGTQAELLQNVLIKKFGENSTYLFNTGTRLRELTNHKEFLTARLLQEKIMKQGGKAPDAIAIWAYTEELIHGVEEGKHIIIDGSPRTLLEAQTIEEIFEFYERPNMYHIWLDTSHDVVFERMMKRGRFDDVPDNINNRLAYYEKYVVPAIEFYKNDKAHKLVLVNGDLSVEQIHSDIIKSIGL